MACRLPGICVLIGSLLAWGCTRDESGTCQADKDCPPGKYCQTTTGVCVSDCVNDGDCTEGQVCTPRGQCVPGCNQTNDGIEECDGIDNDCDDQTDEGLERDCHRENQYGYCVGTESCLAAEWVCDAPVPKAEDCDGIDNDCDGETDEGQQTLICPLQAGICVGIVRTCLGSLGWSVCDYGSDYQAEEARCDDKDNDCDGSTDENLVGNACFEENGFGRCEGVERCQRGQWVCDAPVPAAEECDTLDNDCDGETDEGAAQTPECETGPRAFDGLDNNCNGLIDEPGGCMVRVQIEDVDTYVDVYEATVFGSPDCTGVRYGLDLDDYPADWPADSATNWTDLYACSVPGVRPSRWISKFRAQRACHAQGKRLCSRQEYWLACAGEQLSRYPYGDEYQLDACNTFTSGHDETTECGSLPQCQSPTGIYDMSGNLWEWVQTLCMGDPFIGTIQGGAYYCETCNAQDCVPCDPADVGTAEWVDGMHACYYAGPNGWWCEYPAQARATFGFRCCWDPP